MGKETFKSIIIFSLGIFVSSCTSELGSADNLKTYKTDPNELSNNELIELAESYARIEDKPAIYLSTFTKEFESNTLVAEERYSGRPVKLLAKINAVDGDPYGYVSVQLTAPYEQYSFDFITCSRVTKKTALLLRKGQVQNVYGTVTSTDFGVTMNWCMFPDITNSSPSSLLSKYKQNINSKQ
tara:strand:- start:257 stop:805 length:549 start_codon:yes stop_codon:yes gene_type:complete